MSPEELVQEVTGGLKQAADLVEAMDNHNLQTQRGWNLKGWNYDLVPWGVRFCYQGPEAEKAEMVTVLTLDPYQVGTLRLDHPPEGHRTIVFLK